MRRILSLFIAVLLLPGLSATAQTAGKPEIFAAINDTAKYILDTVKNPQVDSIGGEWAVIGLARSGHDVPDSYYESYYRTVENYVKSCDGVLHERKSSEYSRVILGLTAAGYDPRNVAGFDLTAPLEDFEFTVLQGLSGPIFALISLDSLDYPNGQRNNYITEILRRQLNDGGWNLAGGTSEETKDQPSEPNLTGMALQALAKYQAEPGVRVATDKALERLSKLQSKDGGFSGWGSENVESTVQVLVALCELGIPIDDVRFVKDGNTLIDSILSFRNPDGSFRHIDDGSGNSLMSAEQALYGLVAAQRALENKNSLYRMSDAPKREGAEQIGPTGLPGKHADVKKVPVMYPGKTFEDVKNHPNQAAIEALAARGIITGKGETIFDPDATMTRAEFAAIVTRGLGLGSIHNSQFTIHNYFFADVSAGDWFCEPVCIAAFYGIVKGVSDTRFNPKGTITRQEAAVMVARAAYLCGMDLGGQGDGSSVPAGTDESSQYLTEAAVRDILAQFDDYRTVAIWAQGPMALCFYMGILDGDTLDIKPTQAVKRCEIAEMLYRLIDKASLV